MPAGNGMPDKERIRAFIAIDLPGAVKRSISEMQSALKPLLPGARWVQPEGIHLTVKFLGETSRSKIDNIGNAMREWMREFNHYRLTPRGLGVFPDIRHPRVLWIGFRDTPDIHYRLVETIWAHLVSYGYGREKRKEHPHLTLARFRDPRSTDDLESVIRQIPADTTPPFTVTGLTLFQSTLSPEGARYTRLYHSPLVTGIGGNDD
ncbi:RNA 2',3'-cyclic phosphodiesterase [bacterium]|nr:RNA 2',3'-cyclic phosphodiesterase [candidate division CSSED10-310 bacterium]